MSKAIELLAPAKNAECGMAAIDHGADAVYIGAVRFGARSAASNSVDDIRRLCEYAHRYMAKVYVTLNTIVFDDETDALRQLMDSLRDAGVDAFIVQDMALVDMYKYANVPLHASTQTDNRTIEKVKWLRDIGFKRVVLARELSLDEIKAISGAVNDIELEAFVHGALCVSYSGQCYASQFCFQRSANRGECAQFCRLKFTLRDSAGCTLVHDKHLLSLKDMCRYDYLEALLSAGVTSFKIEGRLKDVSYVKNVTAAYSQRLDEIIAHSGGKWHRKSLGTCRYAFTPDVHKSFNRGFTDYFLLHGVNQRAGGNYNISSFDTPKAIGEYVGTVKDISQAGAQGIIIVAGTAAFANGDGLCFIDEHHELVGFRVNKAVNNKLYPHVMPAGLRKGTPLYRNYDHAFEHSLTGKSAVRRIPVTMMLSENACGYELRMAVCDSERLSVVSSIKIDKQEAVKPQAANIRTQLAKLGTTVYQCVNINIETADGNPFIPSSKLAEMRRSAVANMDVAIAESVADDRKKASLHMLNMADSDHKQPSPYPVNDIKLTQYPYLLNVSNRLARKFYEDHGANVHGDAFEMAAPPEPLLMQCRLCLRYAMGFCTRYGGEKPQWREPLMLVMSDGRRFRLAFDCRQCQMNIYGTDRKQ